MTRLIPPIALALSALLGLAACTPANPAEPQPIYRGEDWYQGNPAAETIWSGTLTRRRVTEGPGSRTALRYDLVTADRTVPVYAPNDVLEAYVDKPVLIRGKLADLTKEGFGSELWPGSIQLVSP